VATRQLLTYATRGKIPQGKGPIIFCLDESDSMRGDRDVAAKSLALACMGIAAKEQRPFAIIHFADAKSLKVQSFPHARPTMKEILYCIGHTFGGGTNFAAPLRRAVELIREQNALSRADILFLTDGYDALPPSFVHEFSVAKTELDFHLFAILVGSDADTESLAGVADKCWMAEDLAPTREMDRTLSEIVQLVH
jgi:uncharacterized protein with von Willebrand factor type A (vWA) domain